MLAKLLVFLIVASGLWAAVHGYVLFRLGRSIRERRKRLWLRGLVVVLWSFGPLTFLVGRLDGVAGTVFGSTLMWGSFLYMGFFALLLFLLVASDIGLGLGWLLSWLSSAVFRALPGRTQGDRAKARRPADGDPGRRGFLVALTNGVALASAGVLTGLGVVEARRLARVVEQNVPIGGLPKRLSGYRIVQISDLHVGPTLKRAWLESVVAKVNRLDPDMVAITGDLIDGTVDMLRSDIAPLAKLKAHDGVFFVTGNHEYYWNAVEWCEHLRSLGIDVLLNEHRVVERGDGRVVVAGVTDYSASRHLASHSSDAKAAFADAPLADVRVMLAHQPKSIDGAVQAGADLQLSGHTHGGQFFPVNMFVGLAHPFSRGLGKREQTWIYVNPGTGYWGPPLRQGVPAEITLLRLTASS